MQKTHLKYALYIAAAVLFSTGVALLCAVYASQGYAWYLELSMQLSLPPMAFSILWGALFALLGFLFARVLIRTEGRQGALFLLNGVLVALWFFLLFSLHSLIGSLLTLLATLFLSFLLLTETCRVTRLGWLLLVYVLWLGFCMYLNYDIALMN